jgi:hypothetical protein
LAIFLTQPAAQAGTTVSGYLAATSKELLNEAISYAVSDDKAALAQLMATGKVISLKGGLEVELVDTHLFSGVSEIRVRGSRLILWVPSEAFEQ